MIKKILAAAAAVSLTGLILGTIFTTASPVEAGTGPSNISISAANFTVNALTDYSINFTSPVAGTANVTINFSAFGNTASDINLSDVSTNINDFHFTGFNTNPTGVSVNTTTQIITFTGGNITSTGSSINNTVSGAGLWIRNGQSTEPHYVYIQEDTPTNNAANGNQLSNYKTMNFDPGPVDHYSVSSFNSTQVAGTAFNVTIQAQDQYSNNITSGADAAENVSLSLGKTDSGYTVTGNTTASGAATISVNMTKAQSGQSITFTGDTSAKTGTSATFTINASQIASYSVASFNSTQVAGTAFDVTIQAKDQFSNNVTSGADAAENVSLSLGKTDSGYTVTGNTTASGAATISVNMTKAQSGQSITFTGDTSGKTGTSATYTINASQIDHYSVSSIGAQTVNTNFSVTIHAQDKFNNNITTGTDAAENVSLSFGKADTGATVTGNTTASGVATVSVKMTVAQSGQSITFTGDTSGKTGTSGAFTVNAAAAPANTSTSSSTSYSPPPGEHSTSSFVTPDGTISSTQTIGSSDGEANLTLDSGGTALTSNGQPLYTITMTKENNPPPANADFPAISPVYKFSPSGAVFSPAIELSIHYDPANLPAGSTPDNMAISFYDTTTGEWVRLDSTVDTQTDTITAKIHHFSDYAVLADTSPAAFSLTNLSATPATVMTGGTAQISVLVSNTGGLSGTYQAVLKMDGSVAGSQSVTLAGGANQTIDFAMMPTKAGICNITIGGQSTSFLVQQAPTPAAFSPSDLVISPQSLTTGEAANISVTMTNTGDLSGTYQVVLDVDGSKEATRDVTLDGGSSQTVKFNLTKDTPGKYMLAIGDLSGSLKYTAPPPAPQPSATVSAPTTASPAPTTPAIPATPVKGRNPWLFIGIILGVVIVAVIVWRVARYSRAQ